MIAWLAAAALLAVAPKLSPKPVENPIAVIPFKNLNSEPTLDWMKNGIAETMISDLKKSGKTRVVERDQVDRAMTEVALQNTHETEDSTAARIGRLVGAKTIVVGSYQRANKQLRINARFVSVETGEVLDTAKTTGPSSDPFALQDRIVAQLLGVKSGDALPKRKPATTKTVEAYRLYAMSLSVASDAERLGYLKQSLAIDPDFVYSNDDLEALKKRMGILSDVSQAKVSVEEQRLAAIALDSAAPPDGRVSAMQNVLALAAGARRYHAQLAFADKMYAAKLPAARGFDPTEYASYQRVLAASSLSQTGLALQYGERHLKEFPAGRWYRDVEQAMNRIIDQRGIWDRRRPEYEQDLAEKREFYEKEKKDAAAKNRPIRPDAQRNWDWAPCICTIWTSMENELMLENCSAFVAKYGDSPDPAARDSVHGARLAVLRALANAGRFDEARAKLKTYPAETAAEAERTTTRVWPAD